MREALDRKKLRTVYDRVAKRYNFQHSFLTARSDQRGRELVVRWAVSPGSRVLDAGAGTGSTSLLAAQRTGPSGKVVLYDMSDGMLSVAKKRFETAGLEDRIQIRTGDISSLPFEDGSFDVALSTYSMCPLFDPAQGALELYRVVRPGGFVGIAHSAEPQAAWVRWLADGVENLVWHFPWISLGCRSVAVLPALEGAGAKIMFYRRIGVPLWPFVAFVVEKPGG
jgi:demethylmenaquinone methyltransferase / 2-methoxy-6-polyprenyl-1,4-benzoquinol methylase